MSSDRPDGFMMIGLHKLAAQNGDGLIPELHALLTREARMQAENPNVSVFPVWEARPPARAVPFEPTDDAPVAAADNVVAFPQRIVPVDRRKDSA
ncbi:hypothetical protein OCK02_05985 [Rhizobium sp. TRM96647]|uniref:hypothetical protein n=1 Tax=unclassified Rhizobium TaxID=2613769 RepID=UPI0021E7B428|nr:MULTISPECIES: hypothetical protein [unclassified Rhizobium]MCV3735746.1 hypothetical protein [Rhizobium sp. TRM96647]MCV3758592.1 hypothetical protein [Rhizobium sp. TRM96650]